MPGSTARGPEPLTSAGSSASCGGTGGTVNASLGGLVERSDTYERRVPMTKILRWLLTPIYHLVLLLLPPGDDWEELPVHPPFWRFGAGSRHRFSWYFEGKSSVTVTSIDEMLTWLGSCRYVGDKELFQEDDFWQHPRTFERLKEGDCEDFALWAWRKLTELGIPARLFIGKLVEGGQGSTHTHAWVVFTTAEGEFLLEPAAGSPDAAVRPIAEVRDRYRPHVSVDAAYRTHAYTGQLTTLQEDERRRRAFGRADLVPAVGKAPRRAS